MTAVRVEDGRLHVGERSLPFIAGEIQFWRMDPETWEPAVRAAKNAGVTIVSTYLSWRRHEPVRGDVSFDGRDDPRLDVGRFLDVCRRVGALVQLKPGPWICAEEPGGGYPDWLMAETSLLARDDAGEIVIGYNPPFQHPVPSYTDARYLRAVQDWFAAVWDATRAHMFPAGPVVALQLDNEPSVCFQDSLYGADYSPSAIAAFRRWLRAHYDDDHTRLGAAWGTSESFATAAPPRRPTTATAERPDARIRDWIAFKTWMTADYLAALRRMHEDLGGRDLLYTVNLVTHPVHDVPVSHAAVRTATGAATGEDHYYIPPLDSSDIHRLARSAATAREAGEPLAWVPELQAGIWRSPGEVVEYPDPTPLEQEIWWGAAVALGFAGANLYMLADRENWEYAPLSDSGTQSPFFAPIGRLTALAHSAPAALTAAVSPAAVVAWHREDADAAYAVVGTSRVPDVVWHSPSAAQAYENWDGTLESLTRAGLTFDLWDTRRPFPNLPPEIPLVIPPASGVATALIDSVAATGRMVLFPAVARAEHWSAVREHAAHVSARSRPAEHTITTVRHHGNEDLVHLVHWGPGEAEAELILPARADGTIALIHEEKARAFSHGRAPIALVPGHRIYRVRPAH